MNNLQKHNAKLFTQLLQKSNLMVEGKWQYRKLVSTGYMDLSIDRLLDTRRSIHFSLAHNSLQNGDVMADPDMEIDFVLGETPHVVALHYQNDFAGAFTSVEEGNTTQAELDGFLGYWLRNLLEQGHKTIGAEAAPSM